MAIQMPKEDSQENQIQQVSSHARPVKLVKKESMAILSITA